MRLKTRLTLAFLAVAWLPLGASVALLADRTEGLFQERFDERAAAVERAVVARFGELEGTLDRALGRVAADPLLDVQLLQPLAHGQFYGDVEYERAIVREARRLLTSPALDTLRVVDLGLGDARRGRVIALAHRAGEEPPDLQVVQRLEAGRGGPMLRRERVDNAATGAADAVWTLQLARVVGRGDARVALVGGRVLDGALLRGLLAGATGDDVQAALLAGSVPVAATFQGAEPSPTPGGAARRDVPLLGGAATLRIWVGRGGLARALRQLWLGAAGVAGASGLLALLLGVLLSQRLSRPLEALAGAVADVAAGARDTEVPEGRGPREVVELTRAFNQMTRELAEGEERLRKSERVAAWREIARRIAHEIKNPLAPIQMSMETLQRVYERKHPDFDEIFAESTEAILEEVARLKRIVTEFSSFARLPAPRLQPTDVSDLVRHVLALYRDMHAGATLALVGPEELEITADPDQLRQVLVNLVANALQAGARRVEVAVEGLGGGGAVVEVRDDGVGMDEETRARLFTPYFTTKEEGTGLGLAIVQRIVEEHGGEIAVRSVPGQGTVFTLTLPPPPAATPP